MKKDKIGAEECYLALILIHESVHSKNIVIGRNRRFRRWLANQPLLVNDAKNIGMTAARRIFRLLSVVNGFIKRENGKIIITGGGYKFLWAEEFKKFELFKKKDSVVRKKPRYKKMPAEIIGDGYQLIRYKGHCMKSGREFTKAGWISEFLYLKFGEKMSSASVAFLHAERDGDWHEHSRTREIFIFTSGIGYVEMGDKKTKIPVSDDWAVIIEAGIPHKVVPGYTNKGRFLDAVVLSFPGWESKNEYKIGERTGGYDGPVE